MSSASITVEWPVQAAQKRSIVGTFTIGSSETNDLHIPRADVARHHALIKKHGDEYLLVNLGGHQVLVNGEPVYSERPLRDRDKISIGNDASMLFHCDTGTPAGRATNRETMRHKLPPRWVYGVVAATFIAVLLVALFKRLDSGCGRAQIVSPEPGTQTSETITIRVSVEKPECVKRIVYHVGESEVARTDGASAAVLIDPQRLGLPLPGTYPVSAVVESKDGRTQTTAAIPLTLLARGVERSRPVDDEPPPATSRDRLRELAKRLATEITRQGDYVFEDEFLDEIGRQLPEVTSKAAARAAMKSTAEQAFNNYGMPPALGVAMATGLGASDRAAINTLAAKVREVWLLFTRGDVDFMYVMACYGMKPRDVAKVSQELKRYGEADRRNFWLMKEQLKNYLPPEADKRVARLFAAGIVAMNSTGV